MQYIVDSEQFDLSFDLMLRLFLQTGAAAVSDGVHEWLGLAPALRLVMNRLARGWESYQIAGICLYRCYVIWGYKKKILILPALLMLSTLTAIVRSGRILWIRQAASHMGLDNTLRSRYNTAVGIILESGTIYCVATIFLVITVSLDGGFFYLGFGITQQLINIIPMFSLVYVGMKYPTGSAAGHSSRAPYRQHLPVSALFPIFDEKMVDLSTTIFSITRHTNIIEPWEDYRTSAVSIEFVPPEYLRFE
ncbi:hypothetical protein B0H13DRAFT_1903517 [Mycena leptocephala]|nr:hypothetical protein B0H13DRAFT_1903517 [Mycena leptocephala]